MTKFRDGLFGPVIILFTICALITLALAAVYQATLPVIKQGEIKAANEARSRVLASDTFTEVKNVKLPDGVSEIYKADNGAGYVARSASKGYGGPVTFMIGIDNDGRITGIEMFDNSETPGLGTKVGEPDYLALFVGRDSPDAVDGISGATRTSSALKNSITQALEACRLAKEVQR